MAGIYVHVPFCKCRCRYCDFYSTTLADEREAYVIAVCRELQQRHDYLCGEPVTTLYIGGGTPSQLSPALLASIINTVRNIYGLGQLEECTIEVNPDDIVDAATLQPTDWLRALRSELTMVTRVSMGIQSFDDRLLRIIGRRHSARQALAAVEALQQSGLQEINIDLMYGLPMQTQEDFDADLRQAVALGVPHLSAYHLSYEEGTALWRMREQGVVKEADEELSLQLFQQLRQRLLDAGYEHYEISNFALPGHRARHNSSYWAGVPYLGVGPGAHSYDGRSRRNNLCDLVAYNRAEGDVPHETEFLTPAERYEECVMTRLRTAEGISLNMMTATFGTATTQRLLRRAQRYMERGQLALTDGQLHLTPAGIFVSDGIIADLF